MKVSVVLCTATLVNTALAAALGGTPVTVAGRKRALDGILDGIDEKGQTSTYAASATTGGATTHVSDDAGIRTFLGFSSLLDTATSTSTATAKSKTKEPSATASAIIPTGTAYSVIGTLPPIHTPSATVPSIPPATPTASAGSTSSPAVEDASSSSSSSTSEWKIIGVAVIAFTVVAGILLLSVFFDQWWRFLRDLFGGRRKRDVEEELVPDWEKADWHLRYGQDRQRYPSFGSLPSLPLVQPPLAAAPGPARNLEGGKVLGKQLGAGSDYDFGGYSPRTNDDAGPSGVGLGLGRVDSVRREGSPSDWGYTAGQVPAKKGKAAQDDPSKNPFDDVHTPMPDDVYGGVAS
ncbi:hypothetical protein BD413DRAFT_601601 [Trametes elegans]|nr:hypothetical protein BD413DRAFT_601601 [Trametes elegans]